MTDTHCHLDHCADPVAAADPTLAALITVGTTVDRNETALELAEALPNVWAAVGIHPNNAGDARDPGTRERVEAQARNPRVVAIGETGFDTHWRRASLEEQRHAFDWQARLARALDKPLILHVRDREGAEDASLAAAAALAETGWRRGILHCFNGHPGLLEVALGLGWFVSFAGNLTYKSARALHAAAREVPAERLLVETDSPYLTPVPLRGQPNRPANVRLTAAFLAELRGAPTEEVEALTDENARRVYDLP